MEKTGVIEGGTLSKEFSLKDQDGEEFNLSEYKGKKILLSFHPLAWTNVCAKQMLSLENHKKKFDDLNTVAVGISVDSVPCKKAWAKELDIKDTRLLSDFWPHGEVSKKYGLFREEDGFSERTNVIINEEQKVSFSKFYPIKELPDIDEVIEILRK
ncbi:MAG: redoxin domain-containing protein [Thermoplasmatota archaeon]